MPPKATSSDARTGGLTSWLKSSTSRPEKRRRTESASPVKSDPKCEPTSKKQRTKEPAEQKTDQRSQSSSSDTSGTKSIIKSLGPKSNIHITDETGDLFAAPKNTLIIHACNCQGSWGGGIALAFKKHYARAFSVYAAHCKASNPQELLGTALLIAPLKSNLTKLSPSITPASSDMTMKRTHFVGCLFTSNFYGKRKDSPAKILAATEPAIKDLLEQVRDWNVNCLNDDERIGEVRICRINSGLFAVPWEKTKRVLQGMEVLEDGVEEVRVLERE